MTLGIQKSAGAATKRSRSGSKTAAKTGAVTRGAAEPVPSVRRSASRAKDGSGHLERAVRHRLTAGSALRDLADAASFLKKMGLLMQTPHPFLPSVFGAAQGKPAKPGAGGFGQWPAHAWSWAGELAERKDVVLTKVILGKRTLVHEALWPALDGVVRRQAERSWPADAEAILNVLKKRRKVRTDELHVLAGFDVKVAKKRYDRAMHQLEWSGLVICTPALVDNHKHVSIAELWTHKFPKSLGDKSGFRHFVVAAIDASGPVPKREVLKWFGWPRDEVEQALTALLAGGDLRLTDGLLASGESGSAALQ